MTPVWQGIPWSLIQPWEDLLACQDVFQIADVHGHCWGSTVVLVGTLEVDKLAAWLEVVDPMQQQFFSCNCWWACKYWFMILNLEIVDQAPAKLPSDTLTVPQKPFEEYVRCLQTRSCHGMLILNLKFLYVLALLQAVVPNSEILSNAFSTMRKIPQSQW